MGHPTIGSKLLSDSGAVIRNSGGILIIIANSRPKMKNRANREYSTHIDTKSHFSVISRFGRPQKIGTWAAAPETEKSLRGTETWLADHGRITEPIKHL